MLRDAIGRDWQCGTLQVDLNLPERLGAFYIGADGEKHTFGNAAPGPCSAHSSGLQASYLEHYAGKLPFWLAPVQAVVATITSDGDSYANEVAAQLTSHGLRIETDLRNEKIGYKIREHSLAKVPVTPDRGQTRGERRYRLSAPSRPQRQRNPHASRSYGSA